MTFTDTFRITELRTQGSANPLLCNVEAGVYECGLLTILDETTSQAIAAHWAWLLGIDAMPLASSAFGEFFFRSQKHDAVFFFEPQRGKSTFVDRSAAWLLESFLPQPEIKERVLRQPLFQRLVGASAPLVYGQCFIAEPWESLGGSGADNTFHAGDIVVYNSLIAPSIRATLDAQRGRREA